MTPTRLHLPAFLQHCQICLYLVLALLSGALIPVQTSLNAQLARSLGSFPLAANISYLVGSLTLIGLLGTGRFGRPTWSALPKAPRWSLMGGLLGAWYIASSTYFTAVLGTTLTLSFVICGQAITGMVSDHFGWLGLSCRPLTKHRRIAGSLLLLAIFFLSLPT